MARRREARRDEGVRAGCQNAAGAAPADGARVVGPGGEVDEALFTNLPLWHAVPAADRGCWDQLLEPAGQAALPLLRLSRRARFALVEPMFRQGACGFFGATSEAQKALAGAICPKLSTAPRLAPGADGLVSDDAHAQALGTLVDACSVWHDGRSLEV